jgi:hypothetical protein
MQVDMESDAVLAGSGDDGHFRVTLDGKTVTSLEGAENPVSLR